MNWRYFPEEIMDESAQVRKAQENLEKMVHAEINRRVHFTCSEWRRKVVRLLRERESIRSCLESADGFKTALEILRQNDAQWAFGYAKLLEEDSGMGLRPET